MTRAVFLRACLAAVVVSISLHAQEQPPDELPTMAPGGLSSDQALPPASRAEDAARAHERYKGLVDRRRQADATTWKDEREAQRYEATFVRLWDRLRAADDKLAVFWEFEVGRITLGSPAEPRGGELEIRRAEMGADPRRLDQAQWQAFVEKMGRDGFRIIQTEWHHEQFIADESGRARSTFRIVINATGADGTAWYDVTGPIEVIWSDRSDEQGHPLPESIDASGLGVQWRTGPALFEDRVIANVDYPANYGGIIARDLDGDGLSEILCPPDNALLRNLGEGRFERETLCDYPVAIVLEGLAADFTGDGRVDLLVAGSNPRRGRSPTRFPLFLYAGDGSGAFGELPTLTVDTSVVKLQYPNGMTAGDIDGDGDLDLFVPQYLQPYIGGQFPTPYYDANDGFPSYLLQNRGDGSFADITDSAGLEAKRRRRAFRSSFVDLDEDDDLDLIVVSDFAGIDLYANDGTGRFTDVTSAWVDLATNFGMSHAFGDFNTDGFLDLYVTGMGSTTARRLHQMGLGRKDLPEHQRKRMEIGYGNRMYLRTAPGRYEQPAFRDRVARSGWSWGCVALDFDNDGDQDLYVCNGNKSGRTAKDYCTRFWCHDIYSGGSSFDAAQFRIYLDEARAYLNEGISWNGFEHNHLLMNEAGEDFRNVAFLASVAIEQDCRGALVDDVDGDGRPDLIVDARAGRSDRIRELRLLLNRTPTAHRWIGVRVAEAPGVSSLGARITITYPGGRQTAVVVAGDSYGAQHAPVKHFGLGDVAEVESIQVRWADGSIRRVERPAVDMYHTLTPP